MPNDVIDQAFENELEEAILDDLENSREKKNLSFPQELHLFPVLRRPFFPGMAAPIFVEPGPFLDVLKQLSRSSHKCVGLVLAKSEQLEVYKATFDDLYQVGVVARLLRITPLEKGGAQVILNMEKRLKIVEPISLDGLKAKVEYHEDSSAFSVELKAYATSIISTIKEILKLNPLFKEELQIFLAQSDFTEPGKLADFAVALTTASREDMQDVLETFDLEKRLDKSLALLKKEQEFSVLQHSINQKIDATLNKTQKDFFLREQLKTIKKELGIEKDDKSIDREKFTARLKVRKVPDDALKVINDEMEKLSSLEVQSGEYNICRGYLDWLTLIPWGIYSEEKNSIKEAEKILDQDHYGLEDIKESILEFISAGKLSTGTKGGIICLVGPPGVGKTSIGKSIARALNRKFFRFSVGGMRDEAEIKGHRRTYIGAMPGKLIQALKLCETMNPVIMLDEVDKMSASYHGDPASALLEVLDPEQNKEFLDHYLDTRCDLSNVLFIVTANVLDTIPEPLKDRMDILRLSGYIMQEKLEIAKKYLIPRNRKSVGLKTTDIEFSKDGLRAIINGYAREAGVRNLENQIKKILKKVTLKIVRQQEAKKQINKKRIEITSSNLIDYIGKPTFTSDRFYDRTPVGVCMGLAWTSLGGATLYIEAIKVASEKTEMKLTGQAGNVMKESSEIAWSYLQSSLKKYASGYKFFKNTQVHMHIPEGATPKDGPSAGITMVTALLSLLTNTPVLDNLGMTGELTLTGRVLPIGGLKEKLVAARRSGLKTLIFPKDNIRDYDELPNYIKKGLTIHFVRHYDEVYSIAFQKKQAPSKLD